MEPFHNSTASSVKYATRSHTNIALIKMYFIHVTIGIQMMIQISLTPVLLPDLSLQKIYFCDFITEYS